MTHWNVEPSPIDLALLKKAGDDPAFDPKREQALLAAFDAAWSEPRPVTRPRVWQPLALAAGLMLAATVVWTLANRNTEVHGPQQIASAVRPEPVEGHAESPAAPAPIAHASPAAAKTGAPHRVSAHPRPAAASTDASAFVSWPGSDTLPTFESGRLLRLDLPASVALSLGLKLPASQAGAVRADILVGQDGLARAVRVAP